jgi:hypothetical protein
LEELLPKDNENIPFLGPIEPSEPQGFSAEQMIRCEECLRANPPTRVSCLYCVAPLPLTETSARLRKPILRQPEKHQLGYNNILFPQPTVPDESIERAAELLKISLESLRQLMCESVPLPITRTASREEVELVSERLRELGLRSLALSDEELGLSFSESTVRRVKAISFDESRLTLHQVGEATEISWTDITLILPARLIETRVEIKEGITRKPEKEILDTSEFFKDEVVIDFYSSTHAFTWRISSAGFDFSCLGNNKALVVNENIHRLQQLIVSKAVNAEVDDSYQRVRNLLEIAWGIKQETESSGWRRERPGKLSVGMSTTRSNEEQFTRYSRLRYYLQQRR